MPFQIIGDDGRVLSGDEAHAAVLVSGYDDGSIEPAAFVGAATPLLPRLPARSAARPALLARLPLARNLLAGGPQVAPATQGPIREVVQGISQASVAAAASATITITASMLFRPSRLMVGPALAAYFTIDDIRVAADSLFLSAGSVPAEAFLPNAVGASALKRRTAQPGTPITITVTNQDGAAHPFRAALFGEGSDVSSC